MTRRSRAREVALQALHQREFNAVAPGDGPDRDLHRFLQGRLRSGPLVAFAEELVAGVDRHRVELDRLLDGRSAHWRVARMAATDRNVLRIAAYELMHTSTPGPVVVDEAIDLARRYGSEASPRFVAGILGGVLEDLKAAAPDGV
jgi:N utilization substance protein B